MNRSDIITLLSDIKPELKSRFSVASLALFGSVARNMAKASSDVDILVKFEGTATSSQYFGLQFYLEDLLGCNVDLVTEKALRPELRPFVEQEAIHV